jgi:hypothetical protein
MFRAIKMHQMAVTMALIMLTILSGCKSDVEEKEKHNAQNALNLDTFKIIDHKDVTLGNIKGAIVTDKYYSFSLCMSESTLGQKIDRRPVKLKGQTLKSEMTNPSGCIFWDQKIKFDYETNNRCVVVNSEVILSDSGITKTFNYAIDLLENTASDLSRSKGCTLLETGDAIEQVNAEQTITELESEAKALTSEITELDKVEGETAQESKEEKERRLLEIQQSITTLNTTVSDSVRRQERASSVLVLDRINGSWVGQKGKNQHLVKSDVKELLYGTEVRSCVKTQIDDKALIFTQVKVSISGDDGESEPIIEETDKDGCFDTVIFLSYEQYRYSEWLKKELIVKVTSGPLANKVTKRGFFVNPWEHRSKSYLIDALNTNEVKQNVLENPNKKYNRISIDGVMYILIGNDLNNFKVNNTLNLTISKTYQVVLTPRIDRGHRFSKEANQRYEKMHDGKFRLKFMILAPDKADIEITENNYKDFTYITGAEKEVDVKDGIINALISIPVKMTDLPRIAMRTVTIFKLEPIEDTGIRNTVVTGFFKAKIPWIKTNVLQSKALQDYDLESPAQFSPKLRQDLITEAQRSINNKTAEELNQTVIDKESFVSIESDTDSIIKDDINKAEYKKHVEELFSNIQNYHENVIYGNPDIYIHKDAGKIYQAHLEKAFEEVITGTTYNFDDIETGTEEATEKKLILADGDINKLYNTNYTQEKELLNNRTYKKITDHICHEMFKDIKGGSLFGLRDARHPDFKNCLDKPYEYFEINRTMHSKKLNKTSPMHSVPMHLNIGSNFSTGTYQSTYTWESQRVGADVGMKLPLGSVFSAGVRIYEYSKGWAQNTGRNMMHTDNTSQSLQVIVEKFTLGLEGTFQKCVTLSGKKYIPQEVKNELERASTISGKDMDSENYTNSYKKISKSYYYCDSPVEQTVDESWYYLQAYVPSSTLLMDSFGPTEIKFIKVIRGDENFAQMKKIFEDETKHYQVTKRSNTSTPDEKLIEEWGHLIKTENDPSVANKLLINNFESAFPGTITHNEERSTNM